MTIVISICRRTVSTCSTYRVQINRHWHLQVLTSHHWQWYWYLLNNQRVQQTNRHRKVINVLSRLCTCYLAVFIITSTDHSLARTADFWAVHVLCVTVTHKTFVQTVNHLLQTFETVLCSQRRQPVPMDTAVDVGPSGCVQKPQQPVLKLTINSEKVYCIVWKLVESVVYLLS